MAIILSIIPSTQQILAGIPKTLNITSSIPATIFYTFDNTDPTINSNVLVGTNLNLPTDKNPLVTKIWSSNGIVSSEIITLKYESTLVGSRLIRAEDLNATNSVNDRYPFGDSNASTDHIFGSQIGTITNGPGQSPILDGYNADGVAVGSLDLLPENYTFIYSETDKIGQTGRGIGTLPSTVSIRVPPPPPETSNFNSKFFNPRALVIYQSSSDIENQDLSLLNRMYWDNDKSGREKTSQYVYTSTEGTKPFGTALRPQPNPSKGTLTYYYRNSYTNQWIISEEKIEPKTSTANFFRSPRDIGVGFVFANYGQGLTGRKRII